MKVMNNQRGFTLTELITVIVIDGILSVAALPRFFEVSVFEERGSADEVKSVLRHAQKVAIAQHRFVCVAFTAATVTLTIDLTPPSAAYTVATCPGADLTSPGGASPYVYTAPDGVAMAGFSNFYFDALGRPSAAQPITLSGGYTVTVEAETGYVH
jgi:MSHA pilin protein MshC